MQPLTPRQKDVADYVRHIIKHRGEPPTIREIAKKLGLTSTGNIHRILVDLEKKGHIELRRSTTIVELPANRDQFSGGSLTELQSKVYESVVAKAGVGKAAPSVREIVRTLGDQEEYKKVSATGVYQALKALEREKLLALTPKQAHGIALVAPNVSTLYPVALCNVPCAASEFLSVVGGNARLISLPLNELLHRYVQSSIFGVELLDNRQLNAFSKGDYILFERNQTPEIGNIVAFQYHDRVSVRNYLRLINSRVLLTRSTDMKQKDTSKKEKDTIDDIETDQSEIIFHGVAVAAIVRNIRSYQS